MKKNSKPQQILPKPEKLNLEQLAQLQRAAQELNQARDARASAERALQHAREMELRREGAWESTITHIFAVNNLLLGANGDVVDLDTGVITRRN